MTPEDLAHQPFDSSLHGYDKVQVRDYLGQVGREYQAVLSRVTQAEANLGELARRLESAESLLRATDDRLSLEQARTAELERENQELLATRHSSDADVARQVGDEVTAVLQAAVAAAQSIRADAEVTGEQMRTDLIKELTERVEGAREEIARIVACEQERLQDLRSQQSSLRAWMQEAQESFAHLLQGSDPQDRIIDISQAPMPEISMWSGDLRIPSY